MANQDIMRKGWNYVQIKFPSVKPLALNYSRQFPFQLGDKKDPRRFFDLKTKWEWDPARGILTSPAFRVEFFNQVIVFNTHFSFDLPASADDCIVELSLQFTHCKEEISQDGPDIAKSDRVFSKYIQLNGLRGAGSYGHVEHFHASHFGVLQTCWLWEGSPGAFEARFNTPFEDELEDAAQSRYLIAKTYEYAKQRVQLSEMACDSLLSLDDLNKELDGSSQGAGARKPNSQEKRPGISRVVLCGQQVVKQVEIKRLNFPFAYAQEQLDQELRSRFRDAQRDYICQKMQEAKEIATKVRRNAPRAGRDVFIFVHGFKGSSNDFRYLKNHLQMLYGIQDPSQQPHFLLLKDFYGERSDTHIVNMGRRMMIEIREKLQDSFCSPNLQFALDQIRRIHVFGFSMGNSVIQAWLAFEISLLRHGRNDAGCILRSLGSYVSINGPLLGATSTNSLASFGTGVLKAFSSSNANSLRDLMNEAVEWNSMAAMLKNGDFLQEAFESGAFPALLPLDVIAANTSYMCFDSILIFGTHQDGFVDTSSSLLLDPQQMLRKAVFRGHNNLQRFLIVLDPARLSTGSYLEQKSGRMAHIGPLSEPECCEAIAALCYKSLNQL